MMIPFVAPLQSLSGTSRDMLLEERMELADALREAQNALKKAAPNGRDHQGVAGHFDRAVSAHVDRREALAALLTSVQAEMELIAQWE